MKTLRLTALLAITALAASSTFAGPGTQYWNARRADRAASKANATTAAATPEKCESMIVKSGKRTATVSCTGAVANTPKCKAACGS
ncbi:MAG: hypothetical protein H7067_18580 [Burkholderiales bacterium]|nr:hypothetical protein [Opitutaceae bacterium]